MATPRPRAAWSRYSGTQRESDCRGEMAMVDTMLSDEERDAFREIEFGRIDVDRDRAVVPEDEIHLPPVLENGATGEPLRLRRRDGRWLLEEGL